MKKSTNNKSHPKLSKAEEKAKQHLISVGLYGRSVSIVSNAFRFTSKKDINHLCTILKAQAKNGSDIQGYIYINRMGKVLGNN